MANNIHGRVIYKMHINQRNAYNEKFKNQERVIKRLRLSLQEKINENKENIQP